MSDLVEALRYADVVRRALPADEAADALVTEVIARNQRSAVQRKLITRRGRP